MRIWLGFAEGCVLICCSVFSSCTLCCVSVLVCGCPWCWFVVAVAFVIAVVAFPWSVFLFPGSASCPRRQALYDAGHRGDAPVSLGQSEEEIRRGDCSAAGVLVCVRQTVYFWLPGCLINSVLNFINWTSTLSFLTRVLQHATELVKTAASRYDEYVNVKDLSDKISRALAAAKKDNDFIYHDRVPEVKDLEHIGKASLVKATAVQTPLSQKFTGQNDAHMTFS